VTLLPPATARATVEAELAGARAWATRHDWTMHWIPEDLVVRAATYHNPVHRLVEVVAICDSYRALPPAWRFVRPGSDESGGKWFPSAGPGSIFHGNEVICAPWNRLAYKVHGGPHDDWNEPAAWLQVTGGITLAHTIADILAIIDSHLRQSPGMMA
jgi:hypothetical protein